MAQVLNEGRNSIILTDEELFMLANDLLIENNQENDVI
jgi:hypothetical protein